MFRLSISQNATSTEPGIGLHTCSPTTWEAEVGGLQEVRGQLGLQSKTLSQEKSLS